MSKKVAIVTDSNSGISQETGKDLGIFVLPMPFYIDGELYFEGVDLTSEDFYAKQESDADISTSQPSPGDVLNLWDELLKDYDEIVHIPMSSGLSSTCETAMALARDYDGRVIVVDNGRISVTLRQSVMDAIKLKAKGMTAQEIADVLTEHKLDACIYLTVDTLKYLKKGGRVTPAAAAIGSVLSIKPVLYIGDQKIDSYSKVRGWKQAKRCMFDAIDREISERFDAEHTRFNLAYTCTEEEIEQFLEETRVHFPNYKVDASKLPLSITTHIGPGAIAIACSKIL